MIEKSEIRKAIFYSTGCDADDWLDGAKKSGNAFDGAKKALRKSSQEVLSIATVVKRDLDEGNLDGLEPAQVADYAILQITRCRDSLLNASQHYENMQMSSQGEVSAYEKVVDHFKKLHDREDSKIQSVKDAIESGDIVVEEDGTMSKNAGSGNISGVRPTMSISAQRKAESAAENAAATSEGETEDEKTESTVEEKPKKTRKKRRKTKKDEPVDGENT